MIHVIIGYCKHVLIQFFKKLKKGSDYEYILNIEAVYLSADYIYCACGRGIKGYAEFQNVSSIINFRKYAVQIRAGGWKANRKYFQMRTDYLRAGCLNIILVGI